MTLPLRKQKAEAAGCREQAACAEPRSLQVSALRPRKISLTKKRAPASPKGSGLIKLQRIGTWIVVAQNSSAWFLGGFCRLGEEMCQSLLNDQAHYFTKLREG